MYSIARHKGYTAWEGWTETCPDFSGKRSKGELYQGSEAVLKRWHDHFSFVLNITSTFDNQVIDAVEQIPLQTEMLVPLSEEELSKV